MVNFTAKKFVKFYLGSKKIRSHIDAVHACPPSADNFTGDIVEGVVNKINCSGIIAIVSRTIADLNRPRNNKNKEAIDEYRQTIREILEHTSTLDKDGRLARPYLHLAIHGMKDRDKEIVIGTLHGKACSPEVKEWFVGEIKKHITKTRIDRKFPGESSKSVHRLDYGDNFNTFQIEISRTLREKHKKELINIFSDIIIHFNEEFK